MTCRAKGSSPIAKQPRLGCSGSTISARCGGGVGGSGVAGLEIPKQTFELPTPEALMPQPSESLCQLIFKGMHDSEDPQTADPLYAQLLQNCYPIGAEFGARVVGRPGFSQTGQKLGTVTGAFGSGFDSAFGGKSGTRVQGIYQYTQLDGTEYTIVIAGGEFYTYNWSTGVFTADTPSSASISSTNTCYFVTINDKVVISDGTNTPWTWDGTTDVVLSNCPVLYGQPTIYYAKLFGIKNTERSTIVWSEEADPTTGYEAGGYNNAWTLGQTDQEPLYAIRGSNEALFYWRERSIGSIRGAVDADFVNSGTREGVSATIGCKSPDGITEGPDAFYFFDADFRPRILDMSSGRLDTATWKRIQETIPDWDEAQLGQSRAVFDPQTNLALLGAISDGSAESDQYLTIDVLSGEIAGLWTGWTATAMGMVKDGNGKPRIMHGTENGYLYAHGLPSGSEWSDDNAPTDGGLRAITHKVTGGHLGAHMYAERKFLRWDINLWMETDMDLSLYYKTPRGTSTTQTKSVSVSSYPREQHISVGLNGDGRWILPTIEHSVIGQEFGLERWCVRAITYGQEPEIP